MMELGVGNGNRGCSLGVSPYTCAKVNCAHLFPIQTVFIVITLVT